MQLVLRSGVATDTAVYFLQMTDDCVASSSGSWTKSHFFKNPDSMTFVFRCLLYINAI